MGDYSNTVLFLDGKTEPAKMLSNLHKIEHLMSEAALVAKPSRCPYRNYFSCRSCDLPQPCSSEGSLWFLKNWTDIHYRYCHSSNYYMKKSLLKSTFRGTCPALLVEHAMLNLEVVSSRPILGVGIMHKKK